MQYCSMMMKIACKQLASASVPAALLVVAIALLSMWYCQSTVAEKQVSQQQVVWEVLGYHPVFICIRVKSEGACAAALWQGSILQKRKQTYGVLQRAAENNGKVFYVVPVMQIRGRASRRVAGCAHAASATAGAEGGLWGGSMGSDSASRLRSLGWRVLRCRDAF